MKDVHELAAAVRAACMAAGMECHELQTRADNAGSFNIVAKEGEAFGVTIYDQAADDDSWDEDDAFGDDDFEDEDDA